MGDISPVMRACSVEGCERQSEALGYCFAHYYRFKRWGDPRPDLPIKAARTVLDRFWAEVVVAHGCLEWRGQRNSAGYGRILVNGKRVFVHRLAYEMFVGKIPPGFEVDHLCRNRLCVRPDHLEAVTSAQNTLRSGNPAAINARKTHCPQGHLLDGDNLRRTPRGSRRCRACDREQARERRRQLRELKAS